MDPQPLTSQWSGKLPKSFGRPAILEEGLACRHDVRPYSARPAARPPSRPCEPRHPRHHQAANLGLEPSANRC